MSEHAHAARDFRCFVGVERPADDDAPAMLAELEVLADSRGEPNGQAFDEGSSPRMPDVCWSWNVSQRLRFASS